MSVATTSRHLQLRQLVRSGEQQTGGVAILNDIMAGARVRIRAHRPYEPVELESSQGQVGAVPSPDVQNYLIERAAPPNFTVSGLSFSGRRRVLVAGGSGPMAPNQVEPVWTPVTYLTPNILKIRRSGKRVHDFVMPGYDDTETVTMGGSTSLVPNLDDPNRQSEPRTRHMLRARYSADPADTVTVPAALITLAGGEAQVSGQWPGGHFNLVPGSIRVIFATGEFLRDDGFGRLVCEAGSTFYADGFVDYLTGGWSLNFIPSGGAVAGAVTVTYQHSCPYLPIDLFIEWDALMAGN